MKKGIVWIVVLLAVAVLVTLRVVRSDSEAPARSIEEIHAEEGVPVDVVTVGDGTLEVVRQLVGEVKGFRQSVLRASADYKIADVLVHEGEHVKRGQTIARYDVATTADFTARLEQAKEAYDNAKRQVDRLTPLFAQGAISESDLDAANTQLAIAAADLRNARLELEVVSPIDGVAALVAVGRGDAVASGDVVAQVSVLDSLRVDADVSAENARAVKVGAPVRVSLEGGLTVRGRISRVSLAPDPNTRLFRVEATLDNRERRLQPGVIVTLQATVKRVGPVRVVPRAAALGAESLDSGANAEVYVVEGDAAVRRPVEVGVVTETAFEARTGIDDGAAVVVFGANRLEDGARVRIHRRDGALVEAGNTP